MNTWCIQGYLAHKKQRPPGTLQKDYVEDLGSHRGTRGGGCFSYERGTPLGYGSGFRVSGVDIGTLWLWV